MRILIATAVYYPMINGVAVFSHNLALGLSGRGHEVVVVCPSQNGKNYTEMQDGVKVCYLKSIQAKVYPDQIHAVPKKKKLFYKHGFRVSVFPRRQIKKIMDVFQPDVVHVQVSDMIGLSVVSYARKIGVPVVTTEHNQPNVITEPLKLGLIKKPANSVLTAYFFNRQNKSDFVTMPTEKAIKDLIKARGKEFKVPVAAVSNGVDLKNFCYKKAPKALYEKYGLRPHYKTVLYLGRIDPEKNLGLVIDAFLEVKKTIPDIQLVMIGDGVDKSRLEKKTAGMRDLHFLGRIVAPELYEVYHLGDVFATASEIETQGIVLVEAAACGLPLIAVDAGAVSEICVNGENGILCKPGNLSELSHALSLLLTDDELREKYAKKSLEIVKKHDFENTLDQFENIYRHVTKNKRA